MNYAGKNILELPPNLQCACPNDQLRFICTVVIEDSLGSTIWRGTAFTGCDGDEIRLRHINLNMALQCNSGAISGRSLGIDGNCTTSELDVVVDSSLNNKTVQCILDSNSGNPTIGEAMITLVTGKCVHVCFHLASYHGLPMFFNVSCEWV